MNSTELRELDAWIAEHVMGWRKVMVLASWCDKQGIKQANLMDYSPTTDPAAVMQVLEKCVGKCGGVEIYDSTVSRVKCFSIGQVGRGNVSSQAETLPLAICLFAKKVFAE